MFKYDVEHKKVNDAAMYDDSLKTDVYILSTITLPHAALAASLLQIGSYC